MKKYFLVVTILIGIIAVVLYYPHKATAPSSAHTANPAIQSPHSTDTFNKSQYSTTDPTSIWVVVNKQHPLTPKDYVPADLVVPQVPLRVPGNESMQLRKVSATALESMFAAAKQQNVQLMLSSGYRSYAYQVSLYGHYVSTQGQETADTQSARPGYSEHQTGLAADVEPFNQSCDVDPCFANTPEGKWVAANAYKYGFITRYTAGNEDTTGYDPEPWHLRYVGTDLSNELHKTGISTLEQFFDVTGGKLYK